MFKKILEKIKQNKWFVVVLIVTPLLVFFASTLLWENKYWDNLTLFETINQLATPVDGVGNNMLADFKIQCIMPAVYSIIAVVIMDYSLGFYKFREGVRRYFAILNPILLFCTFVLAFNLLKVPEYIKYSLIDSNFIEENYVDPATTEIKFPAQKRNLIYIWLESAESTYAGKDEGGAFEEGCIPELVSLAEENCSFTGNHGGVNGGLSMYGSTWTMGALFAHTTGLPLKIPVTDSSMGDQEVFFPGVTAIGDILEDQGYTQSLLIGSDAGFGGRDLFFTKHGEYNIWDYIYSKKEGEIPEDYRVWWGYEDAKLYEFAKKHLLELAKTSQPFNLSMLTVDTHFPDGYECDLCEPKQGEDSYTTVWRCSSRQLVDFIDWIKKQDFYENTTIVVAGDHITMEVGFCDNLPNYQRKVYTTIINPAAEPLIDKYRDYTTFDMFPTTLAALGVEIKGNRLGLGTNLFSKEATLLESIGVDEFNNVLKMKSELLDSLSGLGPEAYALQELLATAEDMMMVEHTEKGLNCKALLPKLPEGTEAQKFAIFAEIINGDTRTTLWSGDAKRSEKIISVYDIYETTIPEDFLKKNPEFVINCYLTTQYGKFKVDYGYLYNENSTKLVRSTPNFEEVQ